MLLTAAAIIARLIPITNHIVLGIAALSPSLTAAAATAAALLLITRRWFTAAVAIALTAAAVAVGLPLFTGAAPNQGTIVRVFTANVKKGQADPKALLDIANNTADVVIPEELTPELAHALNQHGIKALPLPGPRARRVRLRRRHLEPFPHRPLAGGNPKPPGHSGHHQRRGQRQSRRRRRRFQRHLRHGPVPQPAHQRILRCRSTIRRGNHPDLPRGQLGSTTAGDRSRPDLQRHSHRRADRQSPRLRSSGTAGDGKAYASSVKFRVTAGSTGMPGPVVVDTVIFFR